MQRFSVRVVPARPTTAKEDRQSAWNVYEKLLKFWPLITLCALLLAFLKEAGYYDSFHVNVLNYVSAPELLLSLLPLTVPITVTLYVPLYVSMIQQNLFSKRSVKKKPVSSLLNLIIMLVWTIGAGCAGFFIPVSSNWYRMTPYFQVGSWFFPGIDIFLTYIQPRTHRLVTIDLLIPLILTSSAVYTYGNFDADMVKKKGPDKSYAFKWKDKLIKTDSTLYVVGDLSGYLFFYRPKDSTTAVYKRSEIDSLVVKSIR